MSFFSPLCVYGSVKVLVSSAQNLTASQGVRLQACSGLMAVILISEESAEGMHPDFPLT